MGAVADTGAGGRTAGRWQGVSRMIAADLLVVATGVGTYFGVRGLTVGDAGSARENAHDVLAVEKELGLDIEAGVQDLLVDVEGVTTVANWVYIWGHWPVIAVTLLWLALTNRRLFLRLRNAMIASGVMGLCIYMTYPVAPPRLADLGLVDTITEQSRSYRVLQPPAFVNQYAAMPSLHVGWDLLVGMTLVAAAGGLLLRTVGRVMPVLMGVATVITANHYVLDVLIGAAFGLAGWAVALRLERRREAKVRRVVDGPAPPGAPLPLQAARWTAVPRQADPEEVLPEQRRTGGAPRPATKGCRHAP